MHKRFCVVLLVLVFSLFANSSMSFASVVDYWPGTSNFNDVVGGNTASGVNGSVGLTPDGFHVQDGSSVRAPGSYDFSGTNQMSIDAWFRDDTPIGGFDGIVSSDGCCDYRLLISPWDTLYLNAGQHSDVDTGVGITYGSLHNIAMTVQGGGFANIYLDGSLVFTSAVGVPSVLPDETAFLFGAGGGGGVWAMQNGIIGGVRIYNSVLSASEVAGLANPTSVDVANSNDVPEPGTLTMLVMGFGVGIFGMRRKALQDLKN